MGVANGKSVELYKEWSEGNHDMSKTKFPADRFVATQHSTAEEKARFCATFARFVLGGFPRSMFKSAFYRRLSCIFGHIANCDADGFWEVWFADPVKQRQFVRRVHEHVPVGDPHYCWSDVERELKSWAAIEAEAVEAALTENERKHAEAAQAETDRRAALASKTCQQFTVVAKSSNFGSFGRRQYILCAGRQRMESPQDISVPVGNGAGRQRAACGRRTRLVRHPGGGVPGTDGKLFGRGVRRDYHLNFDDTGVTAVVEGESRNRGMTMPVVPVDRFASTAERHR